MFNGKQFEVGNSYRAGDSGIHPITVIKRTEKTIWVTNGQTEWMMRIRRDKNGNEYVIDSIVTPKWYQAYTYCATWENV